jgi:hypothetical protein
MSKAVRTTAAPGTPAKAEYMTTAEGSNNFSHCKINSISRGISKIIGGNVTRDNTNTRNVSSSRDPTTAVSQATLPFRRPQMPKFRMKN